MNESTKNLSPSAKKWQIDCSTARHHGIFHGPISAVSISPYLSTVIALTRVSDSNSRQIRRKGPVERQ